MSSQRIHLTICLIGLLVPSAAQASGSVAVTVAAKRYSLTVTQTFRKILAADQATGYYDSVRDQFLGVAARLTPHLDRLMEREAGGGLSRWRPLPVIPCPPTRAGLPRLPPGGTYPTLLELTFQLKGDDRLAYLVRLPFQRSPGQARLDGLFRKIRAVIKAHARREAQGTGQSVKAAPVKVQRPALRVELTPRFWVVTGQARFVEGRLQALAGTLAAALEGRLRSTPGVTLAPFSDKLQRYEDSKRLPGLASVHIDRAELHVSAVYAVRSLRDTATLGALRRALHVEIEKRLGR